MAIWALRADRKENIRRAGEVAKLGYDQAT
jgi:adenylylsulfate kinase-like enzyme